MNIKKRLYCKATTIILATTLSIPAFGEIQEVLTSNNTGERIINNIGAYGNHTVTTSPELQLNQLSKQGKIKSSQLIVKFNDNIAPSTNMTLANFSIEGIKEFYKPSNILARSAAIFSKFKIISFTKGTNLSKAFSELMKDPTVEYVAPNYMFTLSATTPSDLSHQLWGLNNTGQTRTFTDSYDEQRSETGTADVDIDAPEAWDIRHDASNTIIAVIDTGIDYNHEELASNMWSNPGEIAGNGIDDDGNGYIDDIHGYDFADNDSDPMDTHGHGTHCAGTIGAQGDNGNNITGVAWNTQLMALKIFGDGVGGAYTADIVNAILYAADMGAKVSNNSYGALSGNAVIANMVEKPLYDAISAANDAGMLFVAAAGNSSEDLDGAAMSTPAGLELPNIISIAASDHNDEIAYFSNYGKTLVDLSAPGVDIYSTLPGNEYATWSGTSMAAPHVAGAAALLIEENSNLSPAEIKAILMNHSDQPEALIDISGSGSRLNLQKALASLQGSGGSCESFSATNDQHVTAGRASKEVTGQTCFGTFCWGGTTSYLATGTGENLGAYGYTTTTLYENTAGNFSKTENCQSGEIDAPPVMTINGNTENFILIGTEYTLPNQGATALDREDGDITASITTTGSYDVQTPGRYIITYNLTDSAGNKAAPLYRAIHVVEKDEAPQISLFGDFCNLMWCAAQKMLKNTPYQEAGYIGYDLLDGDITEDVFIIDDPMADTSEEGIRFLNYDVIDSSGNHALQHTNRLVAVLDAEMPHIWIRPPAGNFFSYANEFNTWLRPEGDTSWSYRAYFTAIDLKTEEFDWDNDITVTGEEDVDYTTPGEYLVTITATDTDGNTATATQTINVIADTTPPQITLWGNLELNVEIGDFYSEPGGIAEDDLDPYPRTSRKFYDTQGNEIDNPFYGRTQEETTYTIEYLAEDGTGNTAESKFRTVNIIRSHWNHAPVMDSWRIKSYLDAEISGTAFDIDGDLNRIEIEFDGDGNWITAQGLENWSYTPDFYGLREVRFRVVDNNGNMQTSDTYSFLPIAPVVIESHSIQIDGTTAIVTGTASDAENDIQQIEISIGNADYIICEGTTSWSCTVDDIPFGIHNYRIRGLDTYRYSGETSKYYFEITPATPQIDNYEYTLDGNSLIITGTASDADGDITEINLIHGQQIIQCEGTTSFTCTLSGLEEGTTYSLALQANDAYGLQSDSAQFSFTYSSGSTCTTATNQEHIDTGKAELKYNVLVYALGSNDYLGLASATTSLEETSAGVWAKVTNCN